MSSFFTSRLLLWHKHNPRPLPWDNGPRDPYHIWVSEIIMQQTRIEQGASYYHQFIDRFPSVGALAAASLDDVMRIWEGLGYYSRARNMHRAARYITTSLGGVFPNTYEGLLSLPGVGPYTAAAIASFAYNLPYPVVDGNVKRFIARFSGLQESIDDPRVQEDIAKRASAFIAGADASVFNQAIMNFGALVCKPRQPLCDDCVLASKCVAKKLNVVDRIPVRAHRKFPAIRYFHFIVIRNKKSLLLRRREEKDIWQDLYTPLWIESSAARKPVMSKIQRLVNRELGNPNLLFTKSSDVFVQQLSHQTIKARFHYFEIEGRRPRVGAPFVWSSWRQLQMLARPKIVRSFLEFA